MATCLAELATSAIQICGQDPNGIVVVRFAEGVGRESIEGALVCARPAEKTWAGGARCRELLGKVRASTEIALVMRR
ncbi:hypothetical protein NDU88_004377 [Pleurodeles waltl]|uniref:Uncharacterized protein n=1 Tax=Pleurodeles waltl TaxID=8319 RepID=A0AAV7V121_PLEWA|nr:hypothetical protein NDU88_004377 [Pleurodeles waltl]